DLQSALLDLCLRARADLPEGGQLEIKAENLVADDDFPFVEPGRVSARFVLFTVSDDGLGIPPEWQEQMFVPAARRKNPSPPINLSAADAIIKAQGGHLTVNSELGRGTTFKVYLPAAAGALAAPVHRAEPLLRGRGEWVLVVDDEEAVLEATRKI